MKKVLSITIIVLLLLLNISCKENKVEEIITNKENKVEEIITNEVNNSMKVIIDNQEYTINLEDNKTTKELIKKLPLEINMSDLNNNEKYYYLDFNLPTLPSNPKTIHSGDVMLYQNNCLVIFYKTFDTSYTYTKIGHIDNLPTLENNTIKVLLKI